MNQEKKEMLDTAHMKIINEMERKGSDNFFGDIAIDELRERTPYERCHVMGLTDEDLLAVLRQRKAEKCEECLAIIECKPRWRDSGEVLRFNDKGFWWCVDVYFTHRTIKIQLATQQIQIETLVKVHKLLTDTNQVYYDTP